MLTHARVARRPKTHVALTGLTVVQFQELLKSFILAISQDGTRDRRCRHVRSPGAGRPSGFTGPENALLFILIYFRQYPTQELQGIIFGISQQRACELVHRYRKYLEKALGYSVSLPAKPIGDMELLVKRVPDLVYVIDGCERQIHRPKDQERQLSHYSGKKKRHMIKNTVIIEKASRRVLAIGATRPGSVHDKKLIDDDKPRFPDGSTVLQDTGYLGYRPQNCTILMPKKKPKGGVLTEEEKYRNRSISKVRVRVEHSIRGIKKNRICSAILRNRMPDLSDQAIRVSAGLFNFSLN